MLVDSWYDPYLGVVVLVRVIDGAFEKGPEASSFMRDRHAVPPQIDQRRHLPPGAGDDGTRLAPARSAIFTAAIKEVADTRVGDTVTDEKKP